ncbi:hypothetical protein F5146DRAFT_1164039 [Armillaria mellea]|nr:hypothetical protein F5146DRAFT_1164039 [Armillaria mellea]
MYHPPNRQYATGVSIRYFLTNACAAFSDVPVKAASSKGPDPDYSLRLESLWKSHNAVDDITSGFHWNLIVYSPSEEEVDASGSIRISGSQAPGPCLKVDAVVNGPLSSTGQRKAFDDRRDYTTQKRLALASLFYIEYYSCLLLKRRHRMERGNIAITTIFLVEGLATLGVERCAGYPTLDVGVRSEFNTSNFGCVENHEEYQAAFC